MKLEMRVNLHEKQLQERIAAAIKAEGFKVRNDFFHGVHFSFDSGDGPNRPGNGLSASVSVQGNSEILSFSVALSRQDIIECLEASLRADGYSFEKDAVFLNYDPPTGNQFDPGNGATASVRVTGSPSGSRSIAVESGRVRRVSLELNQTQIRKRIAAALRKMGHTVPREDWISFSQSRGDRFESSRLTGSAIVKMPGNVEGSAELSASDIEEMLTKELTAEGYAVEPNAVYLHLDAGGGYPCDHGNGLTATVRVKWTVGVTNASETRISPALSKRGAIEP